MLRNKMKVLLPIIIALLSMQSMAFGQIDSTEIQRTRVNLILNRFHWGRLQLIGGYVIGVDRNGRLTGIKGQGMDSGIIASDPLERFYQFCDRNSDLFGFANVRQEMLLERGDTINIDGVPGQVTINVKQVESGIEVLNGFGGAMLLPDSGQFRLSSISFNFYPDARNVDPNPSISKDRAEEIALADPAHNGLTPSSPTKPTLFLNKFDDGVHLVWRVGIIGGGYNGAGEYLIDAHSGQILSVQYGARD